MVTLLYQLTLGIGILFIIKCESQRNKKTKKLKNIPGSCNNFHFIKCSSNSHCPGICEANAKNAGEECTKHNHCQGGMCIYNDCNIPTGFCKGDKSRTCNTIKNCGTCTSFATNAGSPCTKGKHCDGGKCEFKSQCILPTGFCESHPNMSCTLHKNCPKVCSPKSINAGASCDKNFQCKGGQGVCINERCVVEAQSSVPTMSLVSAAPSNSPSLSPTINAPLLNSILINWDFEDATISPWGPNGGVVIAQSEEHAYSGKYGALVSGRSLSWHGIYQFVTNLIQPGVIYEVSLWAKLVNVPDNYSEQFYFSMHERITRTVNGVTTTNNNYPSLASNSALTNKWKKITGSYQFNEEVGKEVVFLKVYAQGPASASFAIDDVIVRDAKPIAVDYLVGSNKNTEHVIIPQPPEADLTIPRSNCPHTDTQNLVSWSSLYPSIVSDSNLILPNNTKVLVSESISTRLGLVTIPSSSELIFGENVNGISMNASGFKVQGSLIAGSQSCRYETPLTITLHGSRPAGITDITNAKDPSYKGISVTGRLDLHGKRYYRTWTRLAQRAHVGDNYLYLQDAVNWEGGQEIVLITTAVRDSRDWHQNEVFTIESVQLDNLPHPEIKAIVWLTSNVQFDHIARKEYQAEVGLLTRMIKIQGSEHDSEATDIPTGTCDLKNHDGQTTSVFGYNQISCPNSYLTGYGGHVMVHGGGLGYVEGVELYRMGQTNVLGRYPMHFHLLGNNCPGCYLNDSSIHRSFYRCISIHGTNNIVVSENVGFDVIGYCYYLEDGVEEQNTLSFNLAAHIHVLKYPAIGGPQHVNYITETLDLTLPADVTASGFYITNLHNRIIGNVAVGGWAGFAMPILAKPIGPHKNENFAPRERTTLEFDGNTAHSTAHFWEKSAAFYFGGSIFYQGTKLVYNAGRDNNADERRTPCIMDGWCRRAWNRITNSKVFLVSSVGVGSWSGGMEVLHYECHDCGLAAEALVDGFWMDNMVANCRTGESLILPSQKTYWMRADGFFWYDTGQEHIITSSTFRNCGYRSDQFDQYDTSKTRGCENNPYNGCGSGSTVFGFLTHSDQFNPELMQATRGIKFVKVGRKFKFTTTDLETVSGRTQNWLDVDGSVSGLGEPTLIGSGFSSAGLWWRVGDEVMDEQAPLCFIKKNIGPARGLGHIRLEWDNALHSQVGGANTCRNGGSGITKDCPAIGHIRHLGSKFNKTNDPVGGLPITIQPEIVGPVGGFGWLFSLDAGAPHTLKISQVEVMPDTPLLFSIAYPIGTNFVIKAVASCTSSSCTRSCEEIFTRVNSVQEVRYSKGNTYHFDDTTGLLTIRVIMFPHAYTGEPDWKLYNFNDVGRNGEYSLFRFERNGVLLPQSSYSYVHVLISADCPRNGAYCSQAPPITTAYDNVCSPGFEQVSYDRCCDSQGKCEDLGLLVPTMAPTASHAPSAYNPEIIENGDFEDGVCPWSSSSSTLTVKSGVLFVTNRQSTWSGPSVDITNRIRVGSTYKVQLQIKFSSAEVANNLAVKLNVRYAAGGYDYPTLIWSSNVPSGQWTTLSSNYQLPPPNKDVLSYTFYIETPPRNGVNYKWDFMVDNITMVEI